MADRVLLYRRMHTGPRHAVRRSRWMELHSATEEGREDHNRNIKLVFSRSTRPFHAFDQCSYKGVESRCLKRIVKDTDRCGEHKRISIAGTKCGDLDVDKCAVCLEGFAFVPTMFGASLSPFRSGGGWDTHFSKVQNVPVGQSAVYVTECRHVFHVKCLKGLKGKNCTKCPICRTDIGPELPDYIIKAIRSNNPSSSSAPVDLNFLQNIFGNASLAERIHGGGDRVVDAARFGVQSVLPGVDISSLMTLMQNIIPNGASAEDTAAMNSLISLGNIFAGLGDVSDSSSEQPEGAEAEQPEEAEAESNVEEQLTHPEYFELAYPNEAGASPEREIVSRTSEGGQVGININDIVSSDVFRNVFGTASNAMHNGQDIMGALRDSINGSMPDIWNLAQTMASNIVQNENPTHIFPRPQAGDVLPSRQNVEIDGQGEDVYDHPSTVTIEDMESEDGENEHIIIPIADQDRTLSYSDDYDEW